MAKKQIKATEEEVRAVDPKTGALKGTKLARFDLIPAESWYELAEHYGTGAKKYPDHNWRKGYAWSNSYAALQRHLAQFWSGEDRDEETGSKHIIAAAWHCLTLSTFMDEFPEKDDRFKAPVAEEKVNIEGIAEAIVLLERFVYTSPEGLDLMHNVLSALTKLDLPRCKTKEEMLVTWKEKLLT